MSEGGIVMPSCTAANFNNKNNGGKSSGIVPRRKFSFPAVLQSQSMQAELSVVAFNYGYAAASGIGPSLTVATARRRFSNVSDVVSRKLSHTIGWRTAVPTEQIAWQGKALCIQYVRWKLKRMGVYTKKCAVALRCARVAVTMSPTMQVTDVGDYFISLQSGMILGNGGDHRHHYHHNDEMKREVLPAVIRVGLQLERLDQKLYAAGTATNDQSSPTVTAATMSQRWLQRPSSSFYRRKMVVTATAADILVSVSRELFRAGAQVTWAKVVSLVCVAARLAVDCARYGRAEQLPDLIEAVGEVIEDDLAAWIHYNGGWVSIILLLLCRFNQTFINSNVCKLIFKLLFK